VTDVDPHFTSKSIDLVITARPRDIGSFSVRRALPSMQGVSSGRSSLSITWGRRISPLGRGWTFSM
jgi:hypothetical protein